MKEISPMLTTPKFDQQEAASKLLEAVLQVQSHLNDLLISQQKLSNALVVESLRLLNATIYSVSSEK
jgi:hypothetical protein